MPKPKTQWQGKYLRLVTQGDWEYVQRVGGMTAVVLLAEHDGKVILVDQYRTPLGRRCLELPAGLVGDEGNHSVEETALKELEEETGFTATGVDLLGDFYSSPGMVSEGFTLARMTGVAPGGTKSEEDIAVHLVDRDAIPAFIAQCRADGMGIDVRLLLLLGASFLA